MEQPITKEEMFAPLFAHMKKHELSEADKNHVLSRYMFMFRRDNGIMEYKHADTRQYVFISAEGRMLGGKLDTTRY